MGFEGAAEMGFGETETGGRAGDGAGGAEIGGEGLFGGGSTGSMACLGGGRGASAPQNPWKVW